MEIFGKNNIFEVFEKVLKENNDKNIIDHIYENNNDLKSISSKDDYINYVNSIYKSSKINTILYHGSKTPNIHNLEPDFNNSGVMGAGIYLTNNIDEAKEYGNNIYYVKILTKNPYDFSEQGWDVFKNMRDEYQNSGNIKNFITHFKYKIMKMGYDSIIVDRETSKHYIVQVSQQTHILGNEKDIEQFKDYINKK